MNLMIICKNLEILILLNLNLLNRQMQCHILNHRYLFQYLYCLTHYQNLIIHNHLNNYRSNYFIQDCCSYLSNTLIYPSTELIPITSKLHHHHQIRSLVFIRIYLDQWVSSSLVIISIEFQINLMAFYICLLIIANVEIIY